MLINAPKTIHSEVSKFAEEVGTGTSPSFVLLKPEKVYIVSDCFGNVKKHVAKFGGAIRHGWAIWEIPKIFLEAEFHAIWESPLGELIDVTPRDDGEVRVLFLPDPTKVYEGRSINNIRKPLKDTALTRSLVHMGNLNAAFHEQYQQNGLVTTSQEAMDDLQHALYEMSVRSFQEARPNELCPCLSGKKFKHCHGKR